MHNQSNLSIVANCYRNSGQGDLEVLETSFKTFENYSDSPGGRTTSVPTCRF